MSATNKCTYLYTYMLQCLCLHTHTCSTGRNSIVTEVDKLAIFCQVVLSFFFQRHVKKRMLFRTSRVQIRVARWYIFKPKIPIWIDFGGSCNGRCWYILSPLVYFTAIWYILWSFGIFYWFIFPRCTKENLATLILRARQRCRRSLVSATNYAYWRILHPQDIFFSLSLSLSPLSLSLSLYLLHTMYVHSLRWTVYHVFIDYLSAESPHYCQIIWAKETQTLIVFGYGSCN
jgi:hypothetical protein